MQLMTAKPYACDVGSSVFSRVGHIQQIIGQGLYRQDRVGGGRHCVERARKQSRSMSINSNGSLCFRSMSKAIHFKNQYADFKLLRYK